MSTNPQQQASRDAAYPPAPWYLSGEALLRLQPVPVEQVKHQVPAEVTVVSIAPGRTLAGVFLACYGDASTVQYHELIIIAALVRRGAKLGGWISHIYVDDLQSLVAGREVWGLPKQMANFNWLSTSTQLDLQVAVEGAGTLCRVSAAQPRWHWPSPLYAPVVSRRQDEWLCFRGRGKGRIGVTSADLQIPGSSPLAGFGFDSGRALHLNGFGLTLPTPERC